MSNTSNGLSKGKRLYQLTRFSLCAFSEPTDSIPWVKIVAASEQPLVSLDDDSGILTITPQGCDSGSELESSSVSRLSTIASLALPLLFLSPSNNMLSLGAACFVSSLSLATMVLADGHGTCVPTLELEVGIPDGAPVTPRYGETDHYLAATVETVTWGYYDPTATNETAAITMQSGETITVEVITHHSGQDYAKMIRGDAAVEEIFYWEANQTC